MNLKDLIIELSSLDGPSGFEEPAAAAIIRFLTPYVDEIKTDILGNIIAVKHSGSNNAPKLLLDAHMDEIGFIITGTDKGFLRFSALGGVDARMLPSRSLRILTNPPLTGTVACLPVHTLSSDDMKKTASIDDLRIDIGMSDEEAKKAVPVGTPAVYDCTAIVAGENIYGKALDDRACIAVIINAVKNLYGKALPCDLYIMISSQEEVGCRGAKTGSFSVAPDFCIVLDVDHGQTPDSKGTVLGKCGDGPIISVGPNMNRKFTNNIIKTAKDNNIKYQLLAEPSGNSGTNATVIQVIKEGVATALLSIPLKYMHTPAECISINDAESLSKLLEKAILSLGENI